MKLKLKRIVSMLTRMAMKFDSVAESPTEYHARVDYEHEHHFVEHEHDEEKPEQRDAPKIANSRICSEKPFLRSR